MEIKENYIWGGELARIGLGPVMLVKLIPTFDVFMSYTRSTQAKIFSSKRNTKKRTELDSCQNPSTLLCVSYCLIVKEALFLSQKNTNWEVILIIYAISYTGRVSLLILPLTDYSNRNTVNFLFLKTTINIRLAQCSHNCCF